MYDKQIRQIVDEIFDNFGTLTRYIVHKKMGKEGK